MKFGVVNTSSINVLHFLTEYQIFALVAFGFSLQPVPLKCCLNKLVKNSPLWVCRTCRSTEVKLGMHIAV